MAWAGAKGCSMLKTGACDGTGTPLDKQIIDGLSAAVSELVRKISGLLATIIATIQAGGTNTTPITISIDKLKDFSWIYTTCLIFCKSGSALKKYLERHYICHLPNLFLHIKNLGQTSWNKLANMFSCNNPQTPEKQAEQQAWVDEMNKACVKIGEGSVAVGKLPLCPITPGSDQGLITTFFPIAARTDVEEVAKMCDPKKCAKGSQGGRGRTKKHRKKRKSRSKKRKSRSTYKRRRRKGTRSRRR